jgi:hypothetical protein
MNVHTTTRIAVAALVATLLISCEREDEEDAGSPLEGAWSVVSVRETGPDSAAKTIVPLGLYQFGDKHYSIMRVTASQPRTLAAAATVTDAEKLAAYDSFLANAGTYEVSDTTLTVRPIVAKSPNFMAGGSDKYHFRVSGDTLWLSNTTADLRTNIGGQVVAPPGQPTVVTLVLVRQK